MWRLYHSIFFLKLWKREHEKANEGDPRMFLLQTPGKEEWGDPREQSDW
jgi:hypothetical protein